MEIKAAYPNYRPGLVNVALGKRARQSSIYRAQKTRNGDAAVSGEMPDDFAIHTLHEDAPWWQLDLGYHWPLESIVVHNRLKQEFQPRAKSLKIEVSVDGTHWTVLHSGLCYFGGAGHGTPLEIPLQCCVLARYVRISLEEKAFLHLAQVEVFVPEKVVRIHRLWAQHGMRYPTKMTPTRGHGYLLPYSVVAALDADLDRPLIGLRVEKIGRFGNSLIQLANAFALAKRLGLKTVQVIDFEGFHLPAPQETDGPILLPPDASLPVGGAILSGSFLNPRHFLPILGNLDWAEIYAIVRDVIRPHIHFKELANPPDPDELVIHIRSGDLFTRQAHPHYVQPPLSYYTHIVEKLHMTGTITAVRIVTEADMANPCITALQSFLARQGIACRIQSGTLQEDVLTLARAQHVVFGFGTFGIGVCLMADRIKSVHAYEEPTYALLPNVDQVTVVTESSGQYIKRGDWRASPEQLRMMIDHPVEGLTIAEAKLAQ